MTVPAALLHVLVPLAGGAALYLLTRPPSLLLFGWVEAAGLAPSLALLRDLTHAASVRLPAWVTLSLPNALWVYAFTWSLAALWDHRVTRASLPWLLAAPLFGVGFELGQLAGLVRGTFDLVDLAFVVGASALALMRPVASRTPFPAQVKS